jgi:predicted nucleic acid-binding protein
MVSFDTNVLVYATASISDVKVMRARDLIARAFWDAMLWASARRAGVRHLLTEDLQDGFALQGVTFINPFNRQNDQLIDAVLK